MTREAKVVTCCPENRFCLRDGKNRIKSPVHLFELNFLHSMIYTMAELSYVLIFLFELQKYPEKILYYFCLSLILQTLSLLFLCKNLLEIFRNSSSSRIY